MNVPSAPQGPLPPPAPGLASLPSWREEDVYAGEGIAKVRAAAARYRLEEPADEAEFAVAFRLLDETFGPTGEIETADMLGRWFRAGSLSPAGAPIRAHYHVVIARDADGSIAGVRDCFVTVEPAANRAHVLLSHSLVLPEHRRSGVAALLRHVPVALARAHLERIGPAASPPEILLFAEMDQVLAAERITVIRLLAYGKAGFRVIPPTVLPFAQPDFRDEVQHGDEAPRPLPFLCVVRQVGVDATSMPPSRVQDVVEHALAVHRCHARGDHLDAIRDHALAALHAWGPAPVPLLELPAGAADVAMLYPLLRPLTFQLYPPSWRGDLPLSHPDDELAALVAAWSPSPEAP